MKTKFAFLISSTIIATVLPAVAQEQPSATVLDVSASCNMNLGQVITTLGNTQHQVSGLQTALDKANTDLKEAQDELSSLKSKK